MSENLFKLWTTQFSTNIELKLQQKGSKLRGQVREGFHTGKMASPINQIAAISAKAPAGRFSPKNRTDADFTRRWVFPQDIEIDQLIDSYDELRTIVDPKSEYSTNASFAIGRSWDDAVIAAAFGTAYTGQDANGLTSESWSSFSGVYDIASNFKASAAVGLTVQKLIEAKRLLRHYHNDLETDQPTVVIGSQQESDLLNQVEVVSTEFNDRPVLVDGQIKRFLGFDVVLSERLQTASSDSVTSRECIVTVKSGLYLGMWRDMTNRVSIRNDLSSEPYDLYTNSSYGATRLQPGKVIKLFAADSTGADVTP